MRPFLLDVNVLIALVDPTHVHHDTAHHWFADLGHKAWASCALTEMGLLRIVGNPRYPGSPGSPVAVMPLLRQLRALPGHRFWTDPVSLADTERIDAERLLDHAQLTDTHLLALAVAHGGMLATFDRKLSPRAVMGGEAALHLI